MRLEDFELDMPYQVVLGNKFLFDGAIIVIDSEHRQLHSFCEGANGWLDEREYTYIYSDKFFDGAITNPALDYAVIVGNDIAVVRKDNIRMWKDGVAT